MLPLSEMKFGDLSEGVPPCIAWSPDFPEYTFVISVGPEGESLCAAFSPDERWLSSCLKVNCHVLYIEDFEIVVEERKAVRFDNVPHAERVGCLVATGGELRLCAPPALGIHGYKQLPLRPSGLNLPGSYMLAFPAWKAIKRIGETEHVLMQRP